MIAVIVEVLPADQRRQTCLDIAAELRPLLDSIDGFMSVERFQSLSDPGKLLSLSFFRDVRSVLEWRTLAAHREARSAGRRGLFRNYPLRIAHVIRDYGLEEREEAPGGT